MQMPFKRDELICPADDGGCFDLFSENLSIKSPPSSIQVMKSSKKIMLIWWSCWGIPNPFFAFVVVEASKSSGQALSIRSGFNPMMLIVLAFLILMQVFSLGGAFLWSEFLGALLSIVLPTIISYVIWFPKLKNYVLSRVSCLEDPFGESPYP